MSRGGEKVKIGSVLPFMLKEYRFRSGLEIRDMAKRVGLPHTTYHDIESRRRKYVGSNTLQKIVSWMVK